jgi:hypothetical protein
MKWMLVVLVGGMTPVNTDLVFDKFADCLAAEDSSNGSSINSRRQPGYSTPEQVPGSMLRLPR